MTITRSRLLVAAVVAGSAVGLLAARGQAPRGMPDQPPAHRASARTAGAALLSAPVDAAPLASGLPAACLPVVTCDPAGALAGGAARSAARASLDALGGWISDGAVALLGRVGDEIGRTTRPTLDASWFAGHVQVMQTLAVLVVLPLLFASLLGAIVHQDPGRLVRAVAVQLPLAVVGGVVAVQLTMMALSLTDELCRFVSVGLGNDVTGSVANIGLAMRTVSESLANPLDGGFLGFVVALLVAFGALLIWLELLLRSAAIYVAVMFLPLTLSGLVWPVTARWAKRLIEILVALVLSKFVVVAVISLATSAVASDPKDGVSSGLGGAALLLLAGFAPFALLRLVPVVEAGVVGHLEGTSRRPVAAGVTSTQMIHRMIQTAAAGAGGGPLGAAAAAGAEGGTAIMALPAQGDPGLMAGLAPPGSGSLDAAPGGGPESRPIATGAGPSRAGRDSGPGRLGPPLTPGETGADGEGRGGERE